MIVRAARPDDATAVAAIYGGHVRDGLGTFEEIAPDAAEIARRMAAVEAHDLPYLVADAGGGEIAGFAYASPFRLRVAYRFTCEDSVYVHPARTGQGYGRALLEGVLAGSEARGMRQVMAVIGDSANAASIGLHRSLGFDWCGVGRELGYKHDRWVDIVLMQKAIGQDRPLGQGLEF